jgi:hypothetical protein
MMEGQNWFWGFTSDVLNQTQTKTFGYRTEECGEGTMGICVSIEIQKEKLAMARKKFADSLGPLLPVLFVFAMP